MISLLDRVEDTVGKGENAGYQHFLLFLQCFPKPSSLTLSQMTNLILDPSKLKEFAEDNLKFDENDRKFSNPVENTVGKGEIAHYEQFLLFPQCFQKTCIADA